MNCTDIQEKLARAVDLSVDEAMHTADCAACASVAETYSLLDVALRPDRFVPPDGFADGVMARLEAESEARRFIDRPWVSVLFVNAAVVLAMLNVARFIAGVFVPSVGFAGVR